MNRELLDKFYAKFAATFPAGSNSKIVVTNGEYAHAAAELAEEIIQPLLDEIERLSSYEQNNNLH